MYDGKTLLAVITARGGSKRMPGKNLATLEGRPLLAWSIDAARKSKYLDRVILSSDDDEIIRVAREHGCEAPFKRPPELSTDTAKSEDVLIHALDAVGPYDYVVLLQPTSPLRTAEDIDGCVELAVGRRAKSCITVSKVDQHPWWMFSLAGDSVMVPFVERANDGSAYQKQKLPELYILAGSVYVADSAWLRESRTLFTPDRLGYVIPQERAVDIDTEVDLITAASLMRKRSGGAA